jgi:hypothetical protein
MYWVFQLFSLIYNYVSLHQGSIHKSNPLVLKPSNSTPKFSYNKFSSCTSKLFFCISDVLAVRFHHIGCEEKVLFLQTNKYQVIASQISPVRKPFLSYLNDVINFDLIKWVNRGKVIYQITVCTSFLYLFSWSRACDTNNIM